MTKIKQRITVGDLKRWKACYWCDEGDERAKEYEARTDPAGVTPLELARFSWIPMGDRLWVLLREEVIPAERLHLLGCEFTEMALPVFEKEFPDDSRLRDAVETKRRWLRGEATSGELEDVREMIYDLINSIPYSLAWDVIRAVDHVTAESPDLVLCASAWSREGGLMTRKQLELTIAVLNELEKEEQKNAKTNPQT